MKKISIKWTISSPYEKNKESSQFILFKILPGINGWCVCWAGWGGWPGGVDRYKAILTENNLASLFFTI